MRNPFFISAFSVLPALCVMPSVQAQVFVKELPPLAQAPVPSASLKARLKAQIVLLAPQLRAQRHSATADDELALPMAILGDWKMAQQLATRPATFDALYQWQANQLALVGNSAQARQSATKIKSSPLRADALLVLARLDVEKGRTAETRADLEQASAAIQLHPNSSQMGYLGYLWIRVGDKEKARQTFEKAWPVARQEAKHNEANFVGDFEDTAPPDSTAPTLYSQEEMFQIAFLIQSGLLDEALSHFDATHAFPWSLLGANTGSRWGRQHLREWLSNHPDAPDEAWNSLALAEAFYGNKQQARSDREYARAQHPSPPNNTLVLLTLNLRLARELDDEATRKKTEDDFMQAWNSLYPQDKVTSKLTVLMYRLVNPPTAGELEINPHLTQAELDATATQVLFSPTSPTKEALLDILATAYASRKQADMVAKIGRTLAREARTRTLMVLHKQANQISGPHPFMGTALELDGAYWLRRAGHAREANTIALQFAKDIPARFGWQGAQRLYQFGFPEAARVAFDLASEVKKTDSNGQISPKLWRNKPAYLAEDASWLSSYGWKSLAYSQTACNPELPAEWYKVIPSAQLKANVLASWIRAFSPPVLPQAPYGFSHYASVGGMQAGWS